MDGRLQQPPTKPQRLHARTHPTASPLEPQTPTTQDCQLTDNNEPIQRRPTVTPTRAPEALDRPVFHSEADFQHAFAWAICAAADPRLKARLEIQLTPNQHLDLLLTDGDTNQRTALEFKYPRAAWTGEDRGERFNLRAHGAADLVGYDTLKDLQRLESLVDAGTVQNGMLIMLTNEPAYWKKPASTLPTNADAFRINDGITISGTRDWGPKTGDGTKKGREPAVELRGSYDITWQDYAELRGGKGRFCWFALEVQPPRN